MHHFTVSKMGCGGCAKSVTRAIHTIAPNAEVAVDLDAKRVTVIGATVSADHLARAISAAGYPAERA
jgi:copper chaperone